MKWFHALGVAEKVESVGETLLIKLGDKYSTLNMEDIKQLRDHLNEILEDAPPTP